MVHNPTKPSSSFPGGLLLLVLALAVNVFGAANEKAFGLAHRTPWTTSHIAGSPEPPLPFTVERTFTKIKWVSPVFITAEPGNDSLIVIQQGGEKEKPSKILRVRDDPASEKAEPFLEISRSLVYSVEFHPGYRTNGYFYVFSNGPTGDPKRTNRISRFTVSRDAPYACDSRSEKVIIEWESAGHDGGRIVFGHDGMLYISTGDGTSDSDGLVTGQDLSDLLGGVLRIDVNSTNASSVYTVPADNPFVGLKEARPEIWAYGLRNPWRMSIDQKTGQIWAGNNGQDLWESAHLIRRGENYGWSVYEGSHPFYANRKRGPTPLVRPTIEHFHSELRSLTGGVVYYGDLWPELNGTYVYGDYSTGKILGARHDGSQVTWHQGLAQTQLQITSFATDHHGELLITDHAGGIFRLVRAPAEKSLPRFPARLSETGLFLSTEKNQLHPGVVSYSVNAPAWTDGAEAERFIALPDDLSIENNSSKEWTFPERTVLVQTLSVKGDNGAPSQRVETRLLIRQNGQWAGYSYRWNEAQSDATLVDAGGGERSIVRGAGSPAQTWRYPSRSECLACHSRAATFVLGVNQAQMNKTRRYGTVEDNQLRALSHIGLLSQSFEVSTAAAEKLVDPYDSAQDIEARARSYLHVNCSVCHVEAGGGNAKMELGLKTDLAKMNLVGARPQHDTFGIENAMLITPGDPDRSIIYHRLARRGRGQMPPLVSNVPDEKAAALFRAWILKMAPDQKFVRDWKMEDILPRLDQARQGRSWEAGRSLFRQTGCVQCHRFAGEGGSVGPDLTGVAGRLSLNDLLESILLPSKVIAEGYATTEVETTSGDTVIGRVEKEDNENLYLRPLAGLEEVVLLKKAGIRHRSLSKVSNMPTGMVNSLSETEILDLLAFLMGEQKPGK